MKKIANQHTKGLTKEEIEYAKFHKNACKAAANKLRTKIEFAEEELARLKQDWHRLNSKSKMSIRRIVENDRQRNDK